MSYAFAPFFALGITFIALDASGSKAFIPIGILFLIIGAPLLRKRT